MEKKSLQFVWNGIDLEDIRKVMDAPADDAVLSVYASSSMDHLRSLLRGMAENDTIISEELPAPMHDFIQKELEVKFSAEDIELFNQAHEIWKKKGMKFIFILFFRALPYTYMAEKPANVLRMTKLLETHTERRVFETAQFVFDVMDKEWWTPEKRGILTALKVRIMHSSMRHVILENNMQGEKWNEAWGMPISQEDLIATNQVFSLEFFKGLEMLGDTLTPEEQKAWFHTWKTIGKIMGVQDELICKNVEEAWSLQHTVYSHLFKDETHAGISLARALAETLHHFHMPRKLILLMMRRMLADEQFPDCFARMLGPSYKDHYPELFVTHDNEEGRKKHEELLRDHFHNHLRDYYHTLKQKKGDFLPAKSKETFIQKIINWIRQLTGKGKTRIHLFETHLGHLHRILHHKGTESPVDKLEEQMILDSMTAMSGIMIGILSLHFRKGKESGFRIPKNLKENWSLH